MLPPLYISTYIPDAGCRLRVFFSPLVLHLQKFDDIFMAINFVIQTGPQTGPRLTHVIINRLLSYICKYKTLSLRNE